MIRKMFTTAAVAGVMAIVPTTAWAAAGPPENPACRPLAATIVHWLPVLDRAAPGTAG